MRVRRKVQGMDTTQVPAQSPDQSGRIIPGERRPIWKHRLVVRLVDLTLLVCIVIVSLHIYQVGSGSWSAGETEKTVAVNTTSSRGWTTRGVDILTPAGKPFVIAGISWYGIETPQYVPYGLDIENYKDILNQAKVYQYNSIRIPFSNQMWETNPVPSLQLTRGCAACQGLHSRDILALILNYAGSIGLHVILDNHRSDAGSSSPSNGLWYETSGGSGHTEGDWINDWVSVQRWVHGQRLTLGFPDRITVRDVASDGFPTVIGYDLRNEPHTPPNGTYLQGATWGTGDGINPSINPNPNPFAPACVATSTCHDWRLAAERASDTILGDAVRHGWPTPLIFVQGISNYPKATGTAPQGPYDLYRWGGQLEGVNGNANNPGAPIVLNAGGTASHLGPSVANRLVYVTRDYGPDISAAAWFSPTTCYRLGCAPKGAYWGLVDLWCHSWAYIDLPPGRYGACTGGVQPHFRTAYPWGNTGTTPYTQAPVWIGEFGTANGPGDLTSTNPGSQGQWFTDLINFIQSSYTRTARNDPGIPVRALNWTYWAINSDDTYALLGEGYVGLANPTKQFSFLCFILHSSPPKTRPQRPCGATGPLPLPT
jgi:Cellulase (glycosyl hydrolase family 5)